MACGDCQVVLVAFELPCGSPNNLLWLTGVKCLVCYVALSSIKKFWGAKEETSAIFHLSFHLTCKLHVYLAPNVCHLCFFS